MPNVSPDTPDNQRGFFSPQVLLAEVPANTASVTVGIPPNAETILVTASGTPSRPSITVEGTGTLYKYAGVQLGKNDWISSAPTWAFDVSYAVDQEVTVTLSIAPNEPWYIYADAAARVTFDASTYRSQNGQPYMISTVPSTFAADHPPNELTWWSANLANGGQILGAASAGQRYRIFAASVGQYSAPGNSWMNDTSGKQFFQGSSVTAGFQATYLPSGLALATASPVVLGLNGGTATATLVYTVEVV